MKKIELLNEVIKAFGLRPEEVVKNLYESGAVSSDFLQKLSGEESKKSFEDINFIPSKQFVTPQKIEPGMFYYADGLIYPDLVKGNQVSAIVGSVKHNHGLAVGLREADLPWTSNCLLVNMPDDELCGKEATKKILQEAKAQGRKAEAAKWCFRYAFDGLEAGKMFLPSRKELGCVFAHYSRLNKSFAQLGLSGIPKTFHWSSSVDEVGYAWQVWSSDGIMATFRTFDYDRVRCFLEF